VGLQKKFEVGTTGGANKSKGLQIISVGPFSLCRSKCRKKVSSLKKLLTTPSKNGFYKCSVRNKRTVLEVLGDLTGKAPGKFPGLFRQNNWR
jgi:hypothetical protein